MEIKEKVVSAIEKAVNISKAEILLNAKLLEIGVSSMDFFKMMISLSKNIGIKLKELDPSLVTINMTVNDLITYLINKKL